MARNKSRSTKRAPRPQVSEDLLRDLFAAAAMAGILANPKERMGDEDLAESAYAVADQMLVERDRDPDDEDEDDED